MRILFLLLISMQCHAQWNYHAGVLAPMPFYVPSEYIIHPSSSLVSAEYKKNNLAFTTTTGYIRLKGNDLFQSIPVLMGAKYYIDKFHVGVSFGPSKITEYREENYKMLYNFKAGYNPGRWVVELNYFNWEELPIELNTLCVGIFYKLRQ